MFTPKRIVVSTCIVTGLGASLFSAPPGEEAKAKPAADNTTVNKQPGKTADNQKDSAEDRKITQQIRKSLTSDKSLSMYARNVKIITINGTVTLRGPVRSQEESALIESKAKQIAGVTAVTNELTVAVKASSDK